MIRLDHLATQLIDQLLRALPDATEGVVMTPGTKPYRRLDCDGRALLYVRTRRRKQVVRVDVSGLWVVPREASIHRPTASGSATLEVVEPADIPAVVGYLVETVRRTREAYAREERQREPPAPPRRRRLLARV